MYANLEEEHNGGNIERSKVEFWRKSVSLVEETHFDEEKGQDQEVYPYLDGNLPHKAVEVSMCSSSSPSPPFSSSLLSLFSYPLLYHHDHDYHDRCMSTFHSAIIWLATRWGPILQHLRRDTLSAPPSSQRMTKWPGGPTSLSRRSLQGGKSVCIARSHPRLGQGRAGWGHLRDGVVTRPGNNPPRGPSHKRFPLSPIFPLFSSFLPLHCAL